MCTQFRGHKNSIFNGLNESINQQKTAGFLTIKAIYLYLVLQFLFHEETFTSPHFFIFRGHASAGDKAGNTQKR